MTGKPKNLKSLDADFSTEMKTISDFVKENNRLFSEHKGQTSPKWDFFGVKPKNFFDGWEWGGNDENVFDRMIDFLEKKRDIHSKELDSARKTGAAILLRQIMTDLLIEVSWQRPGMGVYVLFSGEGPMVERPLSTMIAVDATEMGDEMSREELAERMRVFAQTTLDEYDRMQKDIARLQDGEP